MLCYFVPRGFSDIITYLDQSEFKLEKKYWDFEKCRKSDKKDLRNLVLAIIETEGGLGLLGPPLLTALTLNLYSHPSTRPSCLPLIRFPIC